MKRSKIKILILSALMICFTGCVKSDLTMEIGKDKTMNLTVIEAFDAEMEEYATSSDNSFKKELEEKGYYVENYNQDGKVGYKAIKQIKNIDDVSSEAELGKVEMTDALSENTQYFFTVKKDFFKNTYKASYTFDSSMYGNSSQLEEEYDPTCEYGYDGDPTYAFCTSDEVEDQVANKAAYEEYIKQSKAELEEYTQGMEMNFNLKLPYKVKSNNATKVTNGGKELYWNLLQVSDIDFEFEIYNMNNIYIAAGIAAGVILVLFILIISIKKDRRGTRKMHLDKDYQPNFLTNNGSINTIDNTVDVNNNSYDNVLVNNDSNINIVNENVVDNNTFVDSSMQNESSSFVSNDSVATLNNNDSNVGQQSIGIDIPPMIDQGTDIDNNNFQN